MNLFRRVLSRTGRALSWTARRLAVLPLRLLSPALRAQALEEANNSMITVTEIPGGHIKFFTPSCFLLYRAHWALTKETDTIRWIDGFEDGDVLWDIGANVGVYSLYAGIRKQVSVLAFEPSAANYYVLARNIQLNEISNRVTAYCLAISGQTEIGLLNIPFITMGSALTQFSLLGEHSPYLEGPSKAAVQGMLGFSIDDFLRRFQSPFPTHLKIDVDGLELSIIEGAQATLKDPRLRSVLVEVNLKESREKQQAFQILSDAGFCLTGQGDLQGWETEKSANHLFEKAVGAGPKVTASAHAQA
jgi:FkbM family methyltransferase